MFSNLKHWGFTLPIIVERELWNVAAVSQEPNQKDTVALWLFYNLIFINYPAVISAPTFIWPPFANTSFMSWQVSSSKHQNASVTVSPNVAELLFHLITLEKKTPHAICSLLFIHYFILNIFHGIRHWFLILSLGIYINELCVIISLIIIYCWHVGCFQYFIILSILVTSYLHISVW